MSWMIKFNIFCAYTAQKLAQLGEKIAQARLPLFASLKLALMDLEKYVKHRHKRNVTSYHFLDYSNFYQ